MSRPNDESVQSESGDRVLSLGAVRVHNGHLQSGRTITKGCVVCSEGLEGFMASAPKVKEKPEVAEGDGADSEEDAALASGSWPDR